MSKATDRVKVTTTIRGDLWRALQIELINQSAKGEGKRDANDVLEELIEAYLKRKGSK